MHRCTSLTGSRPPRLTTAGGGTCGTSMFVIIRAKAMNTEGPEYVPSNSGDSARIISPCRLMSIMLNVGACEATATCAGTTRLHCAGCHRRSGVCENGAGLVLDGRSDETPETASGLSATVFGGSHLEIALRPLTQPTVIVTGIKI